MNIFAYGTLQFPEIWRHVAGQSYTAVVGEVRRFAVFRIVDAVYPGMVPAPGNSTIPGVVYLDVDQAAVSRLDQFEDECYARALVVVDCADGQQREANAYLVRESHRHCLTGELWSPDDFVARGDLERFVSRYGGFHRLPKD